MFARTKHGGINIVWLEQWILGVGETTSVVVVGSVTHGIDPGWDEGVVGVEFEVITEVHFEWEITAWG